MHRFLACTLAFASALACAEQRYVISQGRSLQLDISDNFSAQEAGEIEDWIRFIVRPLEEVYGYWPAQRWQITVSPASAAGGDPIPWAQVHREARDRVEYFVTPGASAQTLQREWTSYHELAHLLIPYQGWGDSWFSEGLATYYQNLLRLRAGVLDEQAMWQAFIDGFARGQADNAFNGRPLHAVSDAMHRNGGFMRVYWSGAWYFLKADTRLRRQSGGTLTLDRALGKLNTCCANERLSVPDMVAKLDALNQVYVFQPLYEQLRASTKMPNSRALLASLGISAESGVVALQQTGPGASLRAGIARGADL
ncbi:MAG: hypothetical protein KDI09_13200 [Halioglobus sp.]|nr:hypothetical protein [Halioglobus sp.]